ncbi:MAG: CpsD/CapB family tyrosine-protein kinase [Anaerolineae bacterium]
MATETLLTLTDPASATAEAYRALRTNIEFASVDDPIKTLLVTSAGPDDDKDITLANLAVTLADGDRQVILVDADLHRPALHTLFGLNNNRGFTDMFRDEAAFNAPPLQPVADTTLRVLTSGSLPQIPSQIFNSVKMSGVLAQLKEMAGLVLFSAPPLMTVTDALLLASKTDATLLVVKANVSKRDHVKGAKSRLETVKANLIGAVLSNAPLDASLSRYYGGM